MKKFFLLSMCLITLLLIYTGSVYAIETNGIHGYAGFRYELADEFPGQVWTLDLHYRFNNWLALGTTEKTFTNGYETYFSTVPAFSPNGQLYEFYIQLNLGDSISIKLSQWCNHPVYSGSLKRTEIPSGVYIEGIYEF
jgi:hypothetical protein